MWALVLQEARYPDVVLAPSLISDDEAALGQLVKETLDLDLLAVGKDLSLDPQGPIL
jgi:hypothetical protein